MLNNVIKPLMRFKYVGLTICNINKQSSSEWSKIPFDLWSSLINLHLSNSVHSNYQLLERFCALGQHVDL